jgi:CMP-N,N'-diacetyllegionaminic acid synthase
VSIRTWALVPARGGSHTIRLKNLVMLGGRPLIDYGIAAAKASPHLRRIVCSTDSEPIAARARRLGIDVTPRPSYLATDDAKVDDVAREFLASQQAADRPDVIVLVQPTSPFVLPSQIGELLALFETRPHAASVHNVLRVPHNHHAWNQRTLDADGRVSFLFAAERKGARHKQQKPPLCVFGNLIAARVDALLRGEGFYAEPAYAYSIDPPYDFDVDGPHDLETAEALLASGAVRLDHLTGSSS